MKKRICLVGFGESEMAALNATLGHVSGMWQCDFMADAATALEALKTGGVDAVVTTMQLPDLTGADLLRAAHELQPQALRFIVGEAADQAVSIDSIGGTHQFIARPLKAQELISRVQRGFALDAWLSTEELRKLTPRLRRLPSLPSTYFELLKQVESPNTSLKQIAEVISRDPVVMVRLLQMVNSAALALEQKITDPADAVGLLGVETLKSLVLCLQVFSQTDEAKRAGISLEALWEHSCTVATLARQITLSETGDARLANDAFTAGLLHDVGRIVLASNLPREYAAIVAAAKQNGRPLHEEEAAQLGVTHAQVGGYLLGMWGMPAPLVEVAAAHHTPTQSSTKEFSLLTAVHAANVFAHAQAGSADGLPLAEICQAHFEAIGLADRPALWQQHLTGQVTVPEAAPLPVVTDETVAGEAPLPEPPPPLVPPLPVTAEEKSSGGLKWALPLAALFLLVAGGFVWSRFGHSDSTLHVNAKQNGPETHAAAEEPVAEVAPVAVPELTHETAAPPAPEPPPAVAAVVVPEATPVVEATPLPVAVEPAPVVVVAVKTNTAAKLFESVKVQGIFYRTANPVAIVNGKTLGIGEKLNGVEVVAIEPTRVTLLADGERKIFKVK